VIDPYAEPRCDDMSDLELLAFRQDSVLSLRQARQFLSEETIRHRVASGHWQKMHRGVLLTTTGAVRHEHRRWAALLAVGPHAVLGGSTALALAGARRDSTVIHVVIDDHHRPRQAPVGVVVHRTTSLPASPVHPARPPRTSPARAVVDAAQWSRTDDAARLVIADAFQRRLVTVEEINDVLRVLPEGTPTSLGGATAEDCAGGSHSLNELEFLRLNRRAGYPSRHGRPCGSTGMVAVVTSMLFTSRGACMSRSTARST
jgi:hypothetical protein